MVAMWVESIGGAVREPVLTFHFLELGLSEVQIGLISTITTVVALVTAPIYGYVQDTKLRGSFKAMSLSCLFCTVGCFAIGVGHKPADIFVGSLVLGLAGSLSALILGHVVSFTRPDDRAMVVAAFIGQQQLLRLIGRLCYPALDYALEDLFQVSTTLGRSRWIVSTCTIVCLVAFVLLVREPQLTAEEKQFELLSFENQYSYAQVSELDLVQDESTSEGDDSVRSPSSVTSRRSGVQWGMFVISALGLVCLLIASTLFSILWPLFVKDKYGWGPHEYAILTFIRGVLCVVVVSLFPVLEAGQSYYVAKMSVFASAVFGFGSFIWVPTALEWSNVHVLLAILLFTGLALAEPSLKSLATRTVPSTIQGVSWGALAFAQGVGTIVGNTAGTVFYQDAKAIENNTTSGDSVLSRGSGEAAFWFGVVALLCAGCLVWISECLVTKWPNKREIVRGHVAHT